jgi:hypothetical protein
MHHVSNNMLYLSVTSNAAAWGSLAMHMLWLGVTHGAAKRSSAN